MKKTVTISISLPAHIVDKLDLASGSMHVSRSAFMTALLSITLKEDFFKAILNSIYGKSE
jgi:metal-responsive CopG/Arc/MetJ family transcriptional regulator